LQTKHNAYNILYVGKIIREKGIFNLLSAFKNIQKKYPDIVFNLDLVGDGQDFNQASKYIEDNLLNNVKLHGWVDDSNIMRSFFIKASCLVCPTMKGYPEGVPRVIDEAHQYLIPVIATRVGGVPLEYKDNSVILIEKKDELIKQLENILFNDKLIANIKNSIRKRLNIGQYVSASQQHNVFFNEIEIK